MVTNRWMLACLCGLAACSLAHGQPLVNEHDYYFSHGIAGLIEQLGSSSYARRENAYKNIEMFGPMALKQLERYRDHGNTEAKRRVAELIRRAEDRQLTERILAPKEVHLSLKKAVVQSAIAELAAKSGYPIQFQGDALPFADKRITLEGKMPFWRALDQLCAQAGLMERIDVADASKLHTRVGGANTGRPQGPITLVLRGAEKSMVSHAGAFKTELRVSRDKDTQEVDVLLVVSAEPRMQRHTLAGDAVLARCTDAAGKSFQLAPAAKKAITQDEAFIQAELERIAAFGAMDPSAAFRRTAQIRVKAGDADRLIKELVGKLTVQVDLQNEQLAKIDKVLDSAGRAVDGVAGGSMKVHSVKKHPNGNVELQISLDNLAPNPFGGNIIMNGNGGVIIRGNVVINGGGMVIGPNGVRINGGAGNVRDLPDLLDDKGQKFKLATVSGDSFNFVNGASSRVATIVYHPNPGQTEARDLVLSGLRTYTIAVPFRFENVPLP